MIVISSQVFQIIAAGDEPQALGSEIVQVRPASQLFFVHLYRYLRTPVLARLRLLRMNALVAVEHRKYRLRISKLKNVPDHGGIRLFVEHRTRVAPEIVQIARHGSFAQKGATRLEKTRNRRINVVH